MPSPLQRYFALRVKNLFNHLHDFELTGNENAMHDFRVEMKKLRALIKFLRSIYPKQKLKKASNHLRGIFEDAGDIREYQLLGQWLQKNEMNSIEKKIFPAEKMQLMIHSFHQNSSRHKTELKEVIDQCGKFIQNTNEILAEQYVVELRARIEKLVNKNLLIADWHELRKLIKQWMYAANWIHNEEEAKSDSAFSFYNKLQEAIGNWHDIEMIKDAFSQKQIYLSPDLDVQKDFTKAWDKLNQSLKYREKQVEELLARFVSPVIYD